MQDIKTRVLTLCGLAMSIALWLFSAPVQAVACDRSVSTLSPISATFNIPTYGSMIGKPISDWAEETVPLVWGCTRPIYSIILMAVPPNSGRTYSEGGVTYQVVNTTTPGIGMILALSDSFSNITYPIDHAGTYTSPYTGAPRGTSVNVTARYRFIATSSLTAGVKTIAYFNPFSAWAEGVGSYSDVLQSGTVFYSTGTSTITVTTNTCAVTTPTANVPLEDVNDSDLPTISSTAKEKDFHVLMNCQSGVNVFAQLNGTQDPDTTTNGVLQITNPAAATSAKGVGIQILDSSRTPMKIGENRAIKYSNGGAEDMTFYARYYRTRSALTVGAANTVATLNINYQ